MRYKVLNKYSEENHLKTLITECLEEFFFSEEEHSPFNILLDRINRLMEVSRFEERARIGVATCEKFEDYMKNIDKLNAMINEFKGLVAIVRGKNERNKKLGNMLKELGISLGDN
jgi:riboflavin biosynthesis pyrimidine reductase